MFRNPRVTRTADSARFARADITWKCSQHTVWTATHATELLGLVEERDGLYVANDPTTGTYNTYRTLSEAMQAFELPIVRATAG